MPKDGTYYFLISVIIALCLIVLISNSPRAARERNASIQNVSSQSLSINVDETETVVKAGGATITVQFPAPDRTSNLKNEVNGHVAD